MTPKELLLEYYDAFHKKDWKRFSDCLTEDFTYYTDGCTVQDKKAFVEFLSGDVWMGDSYELLDIHCSESESMAFCAYRTRFIGKDGEKEIELNAIESTVLRMTDDGWKIFHSHTSNKM